MAVIDLFYSGLIEHLDFYGNSVALNTNATVRHIQLSAKFVVRLSYVRYGLVHDDEIVRLVRGIFNFLQEHLQQSFEQED